MTETTSLAQSTAPTPSAPSAALSDAVQVKFLEQSEQRRRDAQLHQPIAYTVGQEMGDFLMHKFPG